MAKGEITASRAARRGGDVRWRLRAGGAGDEIEQGVDLAVDGRREGEGVEAGAEREQAASRRKTPLMRVKDGANYVLVGSVGGAPTNPVWVNNLRANPTVEIRDLTVVQTMRVREVNDETERARVWDLAVAAFPPYAEYQAKTTRKIPVFIAEPKR